MSVDLTGDEVFESLTGFDEVAIEKHFGNAITALAQVNPITFGRALVFVLQRREGKPDVDAKEAAMSLTIRQVNDYFADAPGKAGAAPEPQPES